MQTQTEIRQLVEAAGLRLRRRLGQSFLIDRNLMVKLLELAELAGEETVLEVGPATGSLTEELLERAGRVVAVEIDRGLFEILQSRLGGRERLTLMRCDVLAGKRAISPAVLGALGPRAHMVANLPYNVATPLTAECLISSWRAERAASDSQSSGTIFERLTFTVQQELADRLTAAPGSHRYGPVSVIVALLGRPTFGPAVPASAFWPRPKVSGRILRIDLRVENAGRLDAQLLRTLLAQAFGHRRKMIGHLLRRSDTARGGATAAAMEEAKIDRRLRPEDITPEQYLTWSNAIAQASQGRGESAGRCGSDTPR
ncbi:MAG: 16S rRNA (adenine(1518)-N(6)/adenine(1519)-N(6))-dimethyltransferase RsmA [Planctomycetota bacterium]|jgi:16S rRNA (adenine1518-N6/adenine1519-N6)-dimethyltransferase